MLGPIHVEKHDPFISGPAQFGIHHDSNLQVRRINSPIELSKLSRSAGAINRYAVIVFRDNNSPC
jgi:hypothetical protein